VIIGLRFLGLLGFYNSRLLLSLHQVFLMQYYSPHLKVVPQLVNRAGIGTFWSHCHLEQGAGVIGPTCSLSSFFFAFLSCSNRPFGLPHVYESSRRPSDKRLGLTYHGTCLTTTLLSTSDWRPRPEVRVIIWDLPLHPSHASPLTLFNAGVCPNLASEFRFFPFFEEDLQAALGNTF